MATGETAGDGAAHDAGAELEIVRAGHSFRLLAAGVALADLERLRSAARTWDEWLDGWAALGDRYDALGDEAAALGRWKTAAQHWAASSLYYHYGQFLYYHGGERKRAMARRTFEVFRKAAPHLDPPAERLAIPYGNVTIPAYLRRPAAAADRSPCVLLLPGLEATKEELRAMQDNYLARGMATLALDGPGQGESWDRLPMSERYHEAVSACIDGLQQRPDIDGGRLGVVGVSLGGLLAPLAAAHDSRLRACAEVGGSFDMESRWERANILSKLGYMHVTHATDLEEARRRAARLTLEPVAGALRCPLLVVHGGQDRIVPPDQAYMFKERIPQTEFVLIEDGNHVCHNVGQIVRPLVADWMRERLC